MSVLLLATTAMLTQHVPTQMTVLPAHVMQDTVVMESTVMVNIPHSIAKYFAILNIPYPSNICHFHATFTAVFRRGVIT